MPYRRRSRISYDDIYYKKQTKVSIHWTNKSSAYSIKFEDTRNWNEMQIFISYLKNLPYGERDYDPNNKIWYLEEKHITAFMDMLKMLPDHFIIDFIEKQVGQTNIGKFVPVDVYLDKFKTLTTQDIKGLEYDKAKKIYRQVCMKNHPDKGGDKDFMSQINEIWSNLEVSYFHKRKEPEYA